ncbi:MAG: LysM peptidoglycan-binding domain-containing protein [Bacteroidia bacterium]|jgi:LysM repeat protein|nr:LysM peptidoglycan-binding domain-containing protein [Bacteroidia bacterium]
MKLVPRIVIVFYIAFGAPLYTCAQLVKDSIIIHQIKNGDTFASIASKYGVTATQVKQLNKIDKLKVGAKLSIPNPLYTQLTKKDSLKISIDEGHANAESYESTAKVHSVKSGESLQFIANKYKVSPQNLIRWNNLKSKNLFVGQKLILSGSISIGSTEKWNKNNSLSFSSLPIYKMNGKTTIDQYEETGFLEETVEVTHPTIPIGTLILVTNPDTKTQVLVKIVANNNLQKDGIIGLPSSIISKLKFTNEYYIRIQYYL